MRVLELIGDGLTNRQIADRMFLRRKDCRELCVVRVAKLGMHHRTQAAALSVRLRSPSSRLIPQSAAMLTGSIWRCLTGSISVIALSTHPQVPA